MIVTLAEPSFSNNEKEFVPFHVLRVRLDVRRTHKPGKIQYI